MGFSTMHKLIIYCFGSVPRKAFSETLEKHNKITKNL